MASMYEERALSIQDMHHEVGMLSSAVFTCNQHALHRNKHLFLCYCKSPFLGNVKVDGISQVTGTTGVYMLRCCRLFVFMVSPFLPPSLGQRHDLGIELITSSC